jgi:hypothetical protein
MPPEMVGSIRRSPRKHYFGRYSSASCFGNAPFTESNLWYVYRDVAGYG